MPALLEIVLDILSFAGPNVTTHMSFDGQYTLHQIQIEPSFFTLLITLIIFLGSFSPQMRPPWSPHCSPSRPPALPHQPDCLSALRILWGSHCVGTHSLPRSQLVLTQPEMVMGSRK